MASYIPTKQEVAIHEAGHAVVAVRVGESVKEMLLEAGDILTAQTVYATPLVCFPVIDPESEKTALNQLIFTVAGCVAQNLFHEQERFKGFQSADWRRQQSLPPHGPWPRLSTLHERNLRIPPEAVRNDDRPLADRIASSLAHYRHKWENDKAPKEALCAAKLALLCEAEEVAERIIRADWGKVLALGTDLCATGFLSGKEVHDILRDAPSKPAAETAS